MSWEALQFSTLQLESLGPALSARGINWATTGHVAATTSLSRAIEAEAAMATPIATLLDMVVLPGWPDDLRLSLDGFPQRSDGDRAAGIRVWQKQASGRRLRLGLAFDDCLRRLAREGQIESNLGRALVAGRREFSRAVHVLIAAGVRPDHLTATDPLMEAALQVWRQAEVEQPARTNVRRDLWETDLAEDGEQAADLRDRLTGALERVFGRDWTPDKPLTLLHHGFYFYTPPQWALFQQLRHLEGLRQVFLVHDDGTSEVFESWRRFFDSSLDMPTPVSTPVQADTTRVAQALLQALRGARVDLDGLEENVRCLACRNPAEFVRELRRADLTAEQFHRSPPDLYAADAEAVDRYARRLNRSSETEVVDLAHLPVGAYLLALHNSIRYEGDHVALSGDALVDLAATGLLAPLAAGGAELSALDRALPYFEGCLTGEEWLERAEHLLSVLRDWVEPLGRRRPHESDQSRITRSVDNPLARVPWADLTEDDARFVHRCVREAVGLIRDVAQRERVVLREHLDKLASRLRSAMEGLPARVRADISAQIMGLSVNTDEEVELDGLIDVVNLLLGREVQTDLSGEPEDFTRSIRPLRSLDALSLRRADRDLHIANLADSRFPLRVRPVPWPFSLDALRGGEVPTITAELFAAREDTAASADLYLFWLALDGCNEGSSVTLSYVEEIGGDRQNPSPAVALLAEPKRASDAVRRLVGGLPTQRVHSSLETGARHVAPVAAETTADRNGAAEAALVIDHRAAAAARACQRRFAIQWALGPTAAFLDAHHHVILYGNSTYPVQLATGWDQTDALRACDDVWRFVTPGQRASSRAKAVVKRRGALPEWLLTLEGSQRGDGPMDRAYKSALDPSVRHPQDLVTDSPRFLPPGVDDPEICKHCPVKRRCTWATISD